MDKLEYTIALKFKGFSDEKIRDFFRFFNTLNKYFDADDAFDHLNEIYQIYSDELENKKQEIKDLLDEVSVSLNSDNAKQYKEITNCTFDAEIGFKGMQDFIKSAVANGIKTYATVVTGFENTDINVENCEKLATSLGAIFRVREYLNEGYS